MARTRAFSALRRSLLLAHGARRRGVSVHEHAEQQRGSFFVRGLHTRPTRRELLKAGFGLAASAAIGCTSESDASGPRVAIVGAGLSGLLCAYRLQQGGIDAIVFDAGKRVGGRMYTARGKLAGDQLAELGGEFIDSDHMTLRKLAKELDVELDDLHADSEGLTADTFFFGGASVPESAIIEAFVPVAERMQVDLAASEEDDAEFERLDAMSIAEWLDELPDLDPTLRSLLAVGYIGEYGREIEEQSVFNLLWLIDSETVDPFHIYGDSDERFHTHDGNDRIPQLLAEKLDGQIELERKLVRVQELGQGSYRLSLDRDGKAIEREFDKVVFALPWTQLREVELDVPLSKDKQQMIDELGYGQNAKLMLQFEGRPWREAGASGSAFCDNGVQSLWDTARGQSPDYGILTVFLGGQAGLDVGEGSAEDQATGFLPAIDEVFSGSAAAYRADSALRMHWPTAPLFMGSYACFLPGQAAWSGTEGEPEGNLHFCGEHTSEDYQGYMEGAAESGERVADEILAG